MAALNLAVIAPYLPAPAESGGRIRIQQLAKALAGLGELHLFASGGARDLKRYGRHSEFELYRSRSLVESAFVLGPAQSLPTRVRRACPPDLIRAFRSAHARKPFSAVIVEHVHAAGCVAAEPSLHWVLDEHNIESEYFDARQRALGGWHRLWSEAERDRLRDWEQRIWRAAPEVVCVSEADARVIARVRGSAPTVVPNGVDVRSIPFVRPSARRGHQLLFVGLMGHAPNIAAARFLAREVLPKVLAREPRARLTLCGADPTREVLALASAEVQVTGSVPSVVPYLERAAIYVNAVREGAGTSLKTLEALASGLPLISTAAGTRGFELTSPDRYLQADSADQFASTILECLAAPERRDLAAERGRQFAETYDWQELSARFRDLVYRLATLPGANRTLAAVGGF